MEWLLGLCTGPTAVTRTRVSRARLLRMPTDDVFGPDQRASCREQLTDRRHTDGTTQHERERGVEERAARDENQYPSQHRTQGEQHVPQVVDVGQLDGGVLSRGLAQRAGDAPVPSDAKDARKDGPEARHWDGRE